MNALTLIGNAATRTYQSILGAAFGSPYPTGQKHNFEVDFGFPDRVDFNDAYQAYSRNGLGNAGVEKTVEKTWQDNPFLQEFQRDGTTGGDQGETKLEAEIRKRFAALRIWQNMAEADRRSMVGRYAGLLIRFGDGRRLDQPVARVPGGLRGLVEVIPAWEGQLTPSDWNRDETSETFGQPSMYRFNEGAVGDQKEPRSFNIHPDRVIVWSKDGTLAGRSALEPGFNDLQTIAKIVGAGGEGFYKNAKAGLSLEMAPEVKLTDVAKASGTTPDAFIEGVNQQVEDLHRGFDKVLLTQGIKVTPIQVTMPSPEHPFAVAAQSFAASMKIPMKILVGSQTGERASTEDSEEWDRTCSSRRANQTVPLIMTFVDRLVRFGILKEHDWHLDWTSLLDPSPNEMLERVERMATVNDKMRASGELVFTGDEMRAETGREPLSDADKYDTEDEDEETDAIGEPADDPAEEDA